MEVFWLDAEDLVVIGDRLVIFSSGIVGDAAIVEEVDSPRFELEGRCVVGNRLVQIVASLSASTPGLQGRGRVRVELQELGVVGNRLVVVFIEAANMAAVW